MSESQAEHNLRKAGLLPASRNDPEFTGPPDRDVSRETSRDEELAWNQIDQIFSGRPAPYKFENIGDQNSGIVERGYTRQKTKFGTNDPEWWPDGSPKLQAVIEMQDDATGEMRSLYVSSWRMENAMSEAFQTAGVRGPRKGGHLAVKWVSEERIPGNAQAGKVYVAAYDPPGDVSRETPEAEWSPQELPGSNVASLASEPPF